MNVPRRKQRGQTIALAAVALIAMVGMLAFVIDVGLLMMIRVQLATAADSGALGGIMAWNPTQDDATNEGAAKASATSYVTLNSGIANRLCNSGVQTIFDNVPPSDFFPNVQLEDGLAPSMHVTVQCTAGLVFGLILWEPGSAPTYTISADATAVQGCINQVAGGDQRERVQGSVSVPAADAAADPDGCTIDRHTDAVAMKRAFRHRQHGQGVIEYGLIAAVLVVLTIVGFSALAQAQRRYFLSLPGATTPTPSAPTATTGPLTPTPTPPPAPQPTSTPGPTVPGFHLSVITLVCGVNSSSPPGSPTAHVNDVIDCLATVTDSSRTVTPVLWITDLDNHDQRHTSRSDDVRDTCVRGVSAVSNRPNRKLDGVCGRRRRHIPAGLGDSRGPGTVCHRRYLVIIRCPAP